MPEQVWYRTKLTQSGIFLVWYRTKIRHAGMPMPALVSSMLMPSYGCDPGTLLQYEHQLDRSTCWLHLAQVYTYTLIQSRIPLSGVLLDSAYFCAALTLGLCCSMNISWTEVPVGSTWLKFIHILLYRAESHCLECC
jgi:hypothetical protein